MNQIAEIKQTGTGIALPAATDLAQMFKAENGLEPMLKSIQERARASALAHDPATAKGREGLKSVAYEVSTTKAELDRQGKALTDEQRREVAAVNAGRKAASTFLDTLRDEIKRPAVEWEAKEAARVQALKDRLSAIDAGRADAHCPADQIKTVIFEIEATETGEDWQEYQAEAAIAKDRVLTALRGNLAIAEKREADARELEELRAMQAANAAKEAEEIERKKRAADLADRAAVARLYIEDLGKDIEKPFPVLIHILETQMLPNVDALGEHAEAVHQLRLLTLEAVKARAVIAEQARKDAEAQTAREAEERARNEAEQAAIEAAEIAAQQRAEDEARHQREVEEAAQRERDRIAAEKKIEDDARAKREADEAHRDRIQSEIAAHLATMTGRATPELIALALMNGEVPHCTVRM